MVTTGIMGGLSTFSSFAYASTVLMKASLTSAIVAAAYVVISLVLGYITSLPASSQCSRAPQDRCRWVCLRRAAHRRA
ncbi:MAG: hypothetical protein ACLQHF_04535 [Terracidiphilus sp.]